MPIILESRGSEDEDSSSSSLPSPRTMMHSSIKSEVSNESVTTVQAPSISEINNKLSHHKPLRKFFYNLTKSNRSHITESKDLPATPDALSNVPLGPATYLRPLEHKLKPRTEPRFNPSLKRSHTSPNDNTTMRSLSEEALAIAHNRERTELILNGVQSDNLSLTDLDTTASEGSARSDDDNDLVSKISKAVDDNGLASKISKADNNNNLVSKIFKAGADMSKEELEEGIKQEIALHHHQIARSGARHKALLGAWKDYVECYSTRKFNLNNPPFPPAAHSAFKYLPSIYPEFELQRRSIDEALDVAWFSWSQVEAGTIIKTVMNTFSTHYASISFFDQNNEMFKVENGYHQANVPRSISIAAHALLSDEILVILDTKLDWRFRSNPLVISQNPRIRFFAGVPILTDGGLPVGVLAIFSKRARKSFSPEERRQLQEFGARTMKSLATQREGMGRRSTPILQRESVINGDYHPVPSEASTPSPPTESPFEVGLSFPQARAPRDRYSATLHQLQRSRDLDNWVRQSRENLPTPPRTATEKGDNPSQALGEASNHVFSNNVDDSPSNAGVSIFPFLQDMLIPDGEGYGYRTSRPFSSSDITSLNIQPTNTPCNSLIFTESPQSQGEREAEEKKSRVNTGFQLNGSQDITLEEFLGLSDEDCSEEQDVGFAGDDTSSDHGSLLIDMSTPKPLYQFSHEAKSQKSVDTTPPKDTSNTIETYGKAFGRFSNNGRVIDPQTTAAYACAFIAKKLDYELIYAVELSPKMPNMQYRQLVASGGMAKRIVAAHGLTEPIDLCTTFHLNALRSRVGVSYKFDSIPGVNNDYETGYLIPIHTEQRALAERSSGIVIGAFRKRKTDYIERQDEGAALREMVTCLQDYFLKGADADDHKSKTEDAEPKPFPANEAVDINDKFYDPPRGRQIHRGSAQAPPSKKDSLKAQIKRQLSVHQEHLTDGPHKSPSNISVPTRAGRRAYPPQYARQDPSTLQMQYIRSSFNKLQDPQADSKSSQATRKKQFQFR